MRRPVLARDAYHGIVGEIVDTIAPTTEASEAALLGALLTCVGSAVGRGPHFPVGAIEHPGRLFTVIVGDTSRARKGTAFAEVRRIMVAADPGWEPRILGGFGSGEAVVDALRDTNPEGGPEDHRLLVRESEMSRVLRTAGREGSILSSMLRAAWDGDRLEARTRSATVTASGGHVSLLSDITEEELRRELSTTEIANGLGNRCLFFHASRARLLPEGGGLEPAVVDELGSQLGKALTAFRRFSSFTRSPAARERWAELYKRLATHPADGIVGALTARAEAQALRLSVLYAGLDGTNEILVEHIDAAEAVWNYSQATVEHLYGDRTGDALADRLLREIERAGDEGLTFTQQNEIFSGHAKHKELEEARELIERLGFAITVTQASGGRPSSRTFYIPRCERSGRSGRRTRPS